MRRGFKTSRDVSLLQLRRMALQARRKPGMREVLHDALLEKYPSYQEIVDRANKEKNKSVVFSRFWYNKYYKKFFVEFELLTHVTSSLYELEDDYNRNYATLWIITYSNKHRVSNFSLTSGPVGKGPPGDINIRVNRKRWEPSKPKEWWK